MKRSSIAGMGADIYLTATQDEPATPTVQDVPPISETPTVEANAQNATVKPEKLTIYLTKEVSDQLIDAVARRKKARKKDDPAVSKSGIIEEALIAWFRQQDDLTP